MKTRSIKLIVWDFYCSVIVSVKTAHEKKCTKCLRKLKKKALKVIPFTSKAFINIFRSFIFLMGYYCMGFAEFY